MNTSGVALSVLAVFAGMLFPLQTAINAKLSGAVGGPIIATLISFMAGLTALLLITAVTGRGSIEWSAFRQTPPWLLVSGGLLGATYLCLNVLLVPRIGAAAMMSLAISGQMIAAVIIDSQGLFGMSLREVSPGRLIGLTMVAAGAALVRLL